MADPLDISSLTEPETSLRYLLHGPPKWSWVNLDPSVVVDERSGGKQNNWKRFSGKNTHTESHGNGSKRDVVNP